MIMNYLIGNYNNSNIIIIIFIAQAVLQNFRVFVCKFGGLLENLNEENRLTLLKNQG